MKEMNENNIIKRYELAVQRYADFGVDAGEAVKKFAAVPISLHCWQGDDCRGFEGDDGYSGGVITGNFPGWARNGEELRADIAKVLSLCPGAKKIALHTIYAEPKVKKERSELTAGDFSDWVKFANEQSAGLDYNGTYYGHKMNDGTLSLSSPDKKKREFWVKVAKSSRRIAYEFGRATGKKCINNTWIADGFKDTVADKRYYRDILRESLDEIFAEKYDKKVMADTLEGKLFGIGTESFVVGSYDFYLAYCVKNNVGYCFDSGHYHPTEDVSDKFSAVYWALDDIFLHLSRGVRWDSDHVVIGGDELNNVMRAVKRTGLLESGRLQIGLDFFDASINRICAWTTGLRSASRTLLAALLEPAPLLFKAEKEGDLTKRLALNEEFKALDADAVFDYICLKTGVPCSFDWFASAIEYTDNVINKR